MTGKLEQSPLPDRQFILDAVREVFAKHLSLFRVDETTGLFTELALDSLQQLTLVVEIENHFKICFDDSDEDSLETVGDVVDRIVRHLEAKASPAP